MKLIIFITMLSINLFAKEFHHNHKAHVHGGASLAIAFEALTGKIEFKAAADGILGFEHSANSEIEKRKLTNVKAEFETQIADMIKFEDALKCQFMPEKVAMVSEAKAKSGGQHSDWIATYKVQCEKSPEGTVVEINFSKYSGLNDIDITVLVGNLQKSAEYKKGPLKLELK